MTEDEKKLSNLLGHKVKIFNNCQFFHINAKGLAPPSEFNIYPIRVPINPNKLTRPRMSLKSLFKKLCQKKIV